MGNKSNPATEFSEYLCKVLNKKHRLGLVWHKNWHGKGGETADVAGIPKSDPNDRPKVVVEIERLREDPVSNVVKIWAWVAQGRLDKRVLFVQAFTKPYTQRKAARKGRASFVAEKGMCQQFRSVKYEQIQMTLNPRRRAKGIGGASQGHARKLASQIASLLKPRNI